MTLSALTDTELNETECGKMELLTRHGFDRAALSVIDSAAPSGPCRVSNELGYRKGFSVDDQERFWAGVDKTSSPIGCWWWTRSVNTSGYGQTQITVGGVRKAVRAHRWAYEQMVGPIPDGLVTDHLCRVRRCVNPAHLELVTSVENVMRGEGRTAIQARQTHCKWGHPFDAENTYQIKGGRMCKTCSMNNQRRNRAKKREERARAEAVCLGLEVSK